MDFAEPNGPHEQIEVTLHRTVLVDTIIAPEIIWLNEQGVETVGSCTGLPATAMIVPSSVERAKTLGYLPLYREDVGLFEIELLIADKKGNENEV